MVPLLLEGVAGPFVFAIDAEQKQPLFFFRSRGTERGACAQVGATCLVYFLGVRASVSSTRRQYFSTEGMKQRSLGV